MLLQFDFIPVIIISVKNQNESVKLYRNIQHDFMNKRSTVTNLACISQFILEILESSGHVNIK